MKKLILILLLLLRLPAHGQMMISRLFPQDTVNHSFYEWGTCAPIERTPDNGYLLQYNPIRPTFDGWIADPFVIKTDSAFNPEWAKKTTGNLVSLGDGSMLNIGPWLEYDTNYCGGGRIDIERIDAGGHALWVKRVCALNSITVNAAVYANGMLKIAGNYESATKYVSLILDMDTAGNVTNADTFSLSTPYIYGGIDHIYAGDSGNYYAISGYDQNITKMRADNSEVWGYTINFPTLDYELTCTAELPNGDVLVGGHYWAGSGHITRMFLMKISNSGRVLWQKIMDRPGRMACMKTLKNGSVLLSAAGATKISGIFLPDEPLICIDTAANVLWARDLRPDTTYPIFNTLSEPYIKDNNTWVFTAITWNTFAAKVFTTDSTGRGNCPSAPFSASFTDTALLSFTPLFYTTGPIPVSITGQHLYDTLMLTETFVDSCAAPSVVRNISKADEVVIYPNPAKGTFNVRGVKGVAQMEIDDLTGNKILATTFNTTTAIDVHTLASGCYIVRIVCADGRQVYRKLVVGN